MEDSTKASLTIIILATIWLAAQPISGNMTMEAKLDKVPYFNLTNSTVDVHASISGTMPMAMIIPAFISEFATPEMILISLIALTALGIVFIFYKTRRK